MKYTYSTGEWSGQYSLDSTWYNDSPEYIAEDAAKDYYDNHDGWESKWPRDIEVFCDGESLGKFSVEMEFEPTFSATEID